MTPLVITHAGCNDGRAAAWAIWRAFKGDVEFYPGIYNQPPPDVAGRYVILADFSYKRPVMEQILADAEWVTVFDHHESAVNDLAGLTAPNLTMILDNDRCGAMITWQHYRSDIARSMGPMEAYNVDQFMTFVEDRDLWRNQYGGSEAAFCYMTTLDFDPQLWDELATSGVDHLIVSGTPIVDFRRAQIKIAVDNAFPIVIAGHEVLASNCTYNFGSEVAGELSKRCDFGAYYFDTPDNRQWGLRSSNGFDVAKIAEQFGGGGHKAASGFRTARGAWPA